MEYKWTIRDNIEGKYVSTANRIFHFLVICEFCVCANVSLLLSRIIQATHDFCFFFFAANLFSLLDDLENTFIAHISHPLTEMAPNISLFVAYALDTWTRSRNDFGLENVFFGSARCTLRSFTSRYQRLLDVFFLGTEKKRKRTPKMCVVNVPQNFAFRFSLSLCIIRNFNFSHISSKPINTL